MILIGLLLVLSSLGPVFCLVRLRENIPTIDDERAQQRLKILADLNAENEKILGQYHWVDKSKGVVGAPIDRTTVMVLAELQSNKPHPAGPVVTPPSTQNTPPQGQPANQPSNGTQGGGAVGDPKAGQVVFNQCGACHSVEPDVNKQGPSLAGLFGRKAGLVEDFNYSDANKNSGIVWSEAILRKYLADPQSVVPGTKMAFPGLKDPKQIEDVIAYLKQATKK